jgi:hypothetical protein
MLAVPASILMDAFISFPLLLDFLFGIVASTIFLVWPLLIKGQRKGRMEIRCDPPTTERILNRAPCFLIAPLLLGFETE